MLLITALATIVAFAAGVQVGKSRGLQVDNIEALEALEAYRSYFRDTEELLDTLENTYGWADAFDPYNYYESRAKLDSINHKN